jgi:hypothetical protein
MPVQHRWQVGSQLQHHRHSCACSAVSCRSTSTHVCAVPSVSQQSAAEPPAFMCMQCCQLYKYQHSCMCSAVGKSAVSCSTSWCCIGAACTSVPAEASPADAVRAAQWRWPCPSMAAASSPMTMQSLQATDAAAAGNLRGDAAAEQLHARAAWLSFGRDVGGQAALL